MLRLTVLNVAVALKLFVVNVKENNNQNNDKDNGSNQKFHLSILLGLDFIKRKKRTGGKVHGLLPYLNILDYKHSAVISFGSDRDLVGPGGEFKGKIEKFRLVF